MVNLEDYGVWDDLSEGSFSLVTHGSDPKPIKNGMLPIVVPDNVTPGTVIGTYNIHAVIDVFEFDFTVTVNYHTLGRVNFYVPGDSNFASTSPGSMRKKPMGGIFTFGAFTANIGDTLYAYNVAIDSNGNVDPVYGASNLYPVVSYQTDNLGTVIVNANTIPLTTGIISASTTYPITNVFCRLNGCPGIDLVTGSNASITVPVTAGTCFFRVDNALYLLRPADAKSVGFSLSRGYPQHHPQQEHQLVLNHHLLLHQFPQVRLLLFLLRLRGLLRHLFHLHLLLLLLLSFLSLRLRSSKQSRFHRKWHQQLSKLHLNQQSNLPLFQLSWFLFLHQLLHQLHQSNPLLTMHHRCKSISKRCYLKNDCLYYIDVLPKLHWMSSPSFLSILRLASAVDRSRARRASSSLDLSTSLNAAS